MVTTVDTMNHVRELKKNRESPTTVTLTVAESTAQSCMPMKSWLSVVKQERKEVPRSHNCAKGGAKYHSGAKIIGRYELSGNFRNYSEVILHENTFRCSVQNVQLASPYWLS